MSLLNNIFVGASAHATKLDGLAEVTEPRADGTKVVIDTGFGLEPIGEGADAAWREELELEDSGEFNLYVWDGRTKLASLHGRVMDSVAAGSLLEQMNVMSADEAIDENASILYIDMVRVDPSARQRGYAQRLLKVAISEFKQPYVYAQLFSQRVYRAFHAVLKRLPVAAAAGTQQYGPDEPQFDPDEDFILENLDPEPVESESSYKGVGFKLQNRKYVHTLWRLR